jgi:hypothetical protein
MQRFIAVKTGKRFMKPKMFADPPILQGSTILCDICHASCAPAVILPVPNEKLTVAGNSCGRNQSF